MASLNSCFSEADSKLPKYCLLILTVLAVFYTLHAARELLLPLALALLVRFMLMPALRMLRKLRVPYWVSAALLTGSFVALLYIGVSTLAAPAREWIQVLPSKIGALESRIRDWQQPIKEVTKTASQLEVLADWDKQQAPLVQLREESVLQGIFNGGQTFFGSVAITFILLYFLLVYGDKLIASASRYFAHSVNYENARSVAREIEHAISKYLWTVTVINFCLGTVVAAIMYWLGMPSPFLWGVLAGVLNYIPYIGPLILIVLISVVSLTSFTNATAAILPPVMFFIVTSLEGSFLTPLILGKRFTLNPIIIFSWVMLWAWLWGSVGGLMAVPILVTMNIIIAKIYAGDPQIFVVQGGRTVQSGNKSPRNSSVLAEANELP